MSSAMPFRCGGFGRRGARRGARTRAPTQANTFCVSQEAHDRVTMSETSSRSCASSTVTLYGQHKSGTTWLSLVTLSIARIGCIHQKQGCEEYQALRPDKHGKPINVTVLRVASAQRNPPPTTVLDVQGKLSSTSKHFFPGLVDSRSKITQTITQCLQQNARAWEPRCLERIKQIRVPIPACQRAVTILRNPAAQVISFCTWATSCDNAKRGASSWGKSNASSVSAPLTRSDEREVLKQLPLFSEMTNLRYIVHAQLLPSLQVPSHIIFYDDLMSQPLFEYYRLASFLGLNPQEGDMRRVVMETSADAMRKEEDTYARAGGAGALPRTHELVTDGKSIVQSASVRGWRTRVSKPTLHAADTIMRTMLHPVLWGRWRVDNETRAS